MKRFKWWAIECIASIIVIITFSWFHTNSQPETEDGYFYVKFYSIFICSIISVVISFLGLLACIFPQEHNVCRVESILIWVIAICWSTATIKAIIGPFTTNDRFYRNNDLIVLHPNVYVFSLLCFTVSMLMIASWYRQFLFNGNDWNASTQWILLGAMSFYTMLSALSFRDGSSFLNITNEVGYNLTVNDIVELATAVTLSSFRTKNYQTMANFTREDISFVVDNHSMDANLTIGNLTIDDLRIDYNQPNELFAVLNSLIKAGILEALSPCESSEYSCVRINYAMCLGAASAVVSCVMTPWKGTSPTCQNDVAIVLFIFWSSALILLTVSPGPATRAGNLYFGIYFCYFLNLNILITSTTSTIKQNLIFERNSLKSVRRGDAWKTAYGKLERSKKRVMVRSHSYESLFDTPEEWDTRYDIRINDEYGEKLDGSIQLPNRLSKQEIYNEEVTDSGRIISRDDELNSAGLTPSRIIQDYNEEVKDPGLRRLTIQTIQESLKGDVNDSSSPPQPYADLRDWNLRVRRLELWCLLLTVSIVMMYTVYHTVDDRPVILYSITSVSIVASCVGLVTCLRTSKLSNLLQTFSVVSALINWVAGTILFLDNATLHLLGYQTIEQTIHFYFDGEAKKSVDDPNIFFGVFVSIITTILLSTNRCRASLTTTDWLLLSALSGALLLILMDHLNRSESDGVIDDDTENVLLNCNTDSPPIYCQKIKFSYYLGITTLAVSLIMAFLCKVLCKAGPVLHLIVSVPLFIIWGFGIPYNGSSSDPGSTSTAVLCAFWGGTFLSLDIITVSIMVIHRNSETRRAITTESEIDNGEFPNENDEPSLANEIGRFISDQDQDTRDTSNDIEGIEILPP